MKKLILAIIRTYQKSSIQRKIIFGQLFPVFTTCRYTPTCSEYTYEAVKKYGAIKGLFLGFNRLLTCNPFGGKGYKPLI